jgi:farnesyl diphosphate synthase
MDGRHATSTSGSAFTERLAALTQRVEHRLDEALPGAAIAPRRLHDAMRYSVLNGGKRVRPLLVYAAGECLGVATGKLDVPATAIELIHAFSLVHDDLPAMDDDDLRRGQPTVHRKFDEATAILAADALQPLAFQVIAGAANLGAAEKVDLATLLATACGSLGMTGGQAIDLASHDRQMTESELEQMHDLKTGALIRASIMSACVLAGETDGSRHDAMDSFARDVGLAFQIRDDILDVEGETHEIGKPAGSDQGHGKATWPAVFGLEESRTRCHDLLASALQNLSVFGCAADPLRDIASFIVERRR